jgi:hypothetical protein
MRILIFGVVLVFAPLLCDQAWAQDPSQPPAEAGKKDETPALRLVPVIGSLFQNGGTSLPKAPDSLGELRQALDRAMASRTTTILTMDLDAQVLRRAAQSLSETSLDTRSLISTLKSIQVRLFDVDTSSTASLQGIRDTLKSPNWQRYSSYTSQGESVELWSARWGTSQQGVFLISVNNRRVFAMSVEGNIGPDQLVHLSGLLGIPNFKPKLEVPLDSPRP